jgi:hypothetical protein
VGVFVEDQSILVFGALIALAAWWVIGSIAVGKAATTKGLDGGIWFMCSLLLGPILTAMLVIINPAVAKKDRQSD